LGRIGATADEIRRANRLFTPPAADPRGQALERSGDRAARDLPLGESVADAGASARPACSSWKPPSTPRRPRARSSTCKPGWPGPGARPRRGRRRRQL
jgi:hypothetical protein